MSRITVAVLGSGPVAELLARRIESSPDLVLAAAVLPATAEPPAGTGCVVYLPASTELAADAVAARVTGLLRAGFNVVSTVPAQALDKAVLLAACRAGASTFHGTGGFQCSLATRFNRAFAAITRNIRDVELIEELDIEDRPAHPWSAPADTGLDDEDPQVASARALAVESHYDAGLQTLAEAVFGDTCPGADIAVSARRIRHDDDARRARAVTQDMPAQLRVRRTLGTQLAYDSVWTRRQGGLTPLRYRLNTTSSDAIGHVDIAFHSGGAAHPADHLTCTGLLDAIRPACESAPGVLHSDLDINHVKPDTRLAR